MGLARTKPAEKEDELKGVSLVFAHYIVAKDVKKIQRRQNNDWNYTGIEEDKRVVNINRL